MDTPLSRQCRIKPNEDPNLPTALFVEPIRIGNRGKLSRQTSRIPPGVWRLVRHSYPAPPSSLFTEPDHINVIRCAGKFIPDAVTVGSGMQIGSRLIPAKLVSRGGGGKGVTYDPGS